jgi:hypothetical protein
LADLQPEPDERDVVKTLVLLAGESRVYRLHLESARPVIERLATDMDDVDLASLLTSVTVALAAPARLGTPYHIEDHALALLRELTG